MENIKFYKVNNLYGEFSNFFPAPIVLESQVWPTVEHYFQASKFEDYKTQDKIRLLKSPMDAALEGRKRTNILRPDWEEIKDNKMRKALRAKFFQHFKLKKVLLATGNLPIIEHTTNDNYWADGGDGTGKNTLGILLVQVRHEISLISPDLDLIFPPWLAFPSTSPFDLFWGMGLGEEYLSAFYRFTELYGVDKYKMKFPPTDEWQNMF